MTRIKPQKLPDPENLAIRARRGELSDEEQRALHQALGAHATLAIAHRLGCDFDEALRTRPGDDAMIARATQRTLAARGRHAVGPRLRVSVRFAVLAAIASVAASAAVIVHRQRVKQSEHALMVVAAREMQLPATSAGATRSDSAQPATERDPVAAPAAASSIQRRLQARSAASAEREPSAESGATARAAATSESDAILLFRNAGEARHQGNISRAIALYRELQTKAPQSSEARVSRVSLGKLLLASGRASEARRLFDAYLSDGGSALTEEAMVGRADALSILGNRDEERQTWQQLLRLYPASVYAARARQRLQQLALNGTVDSH